MFRIGPTTGVRIIVDAHRADKKTAAPIQLDAEFAKEGGEDPTPYEVLLHAALIGNSTLFARQDSVEASWRIVAPLLDSPPPVQTYEPGTWGPSDAAKLTSHYGGWRGPWMGE